MHSSDFCKIHRTDLISIVQEVDPLWETLKGGRIFMTGATGFVGSWLLESILQADQSLCLGVRITILTRRPDWGLRFRTLFPDHLPVDIVPGDILSFKFPSGDFSHVIHAAGPTHAETPDSALQVLDEIVSGTRRCLEFTRLCGAKRFLLLSSGAVYGPQPLNVDHIPEVCPNAPSPLATKSVYGEGKRLAELLCVLYAQRWGIETMLARGFAFAGPYLPLDSHFALGNFIRDALKNGPIHVRGDGTAGRSYLYASDLAIWLWTILLRGRSSAAYNVGSENLVSIADLAQEVRSLIAPRARVVIANPPISGRPIQRYLPSTDLAQKELGLHQIVDLRTAILRTAQWASFCHPLW